MLFNFILPSFNLVPLTHQNNFRNVLHTFTKATCCSISFSTKNHLRRLTSWSLRTDTGRSDSHLFNFFFFWRLLETPCCVSRISGSSLWVNYSLCWLPSQQLFSFPPAEMVLLKSRRRDFTFDQLSRFVLRVFCLAVSCGPSSIFVPCLTFETLFQTGLSFLPWQFSWFYSHYYSHRKKRVFIQKSFSIILISYQLENNWNRPPCAIFIYKLFIKKIIEKILENIMTIKQNEITKWKSKCSMSTWCNCSQDYLVWSINTK